MMAQQQQFEVHPDRIAPSLRQFKRWAPWRAVWNEKRKKFDKIPQQPGNPDFGLSSAKPEQWAAFDTALKALDRGKSAGIGFCMTGVNGVVCFDLDNCLGDEWALDIIERVGSYTELSPSGNGYRIFAKCNFPRDWMNHEVGIEFYAGNQPRFLTVTGDVIGDTHDMVDIDAQVIEQLEKRYSRKTKSADIIDLTMPALLCDLVLPTIESLNLPEKVKAFFDTGAVEGDRSATLFNAGMSLYAEGLGDDEVLSVLAANPYAFAVAMDHRNQDPDRALLYLWREHCIKSKARASTMVSSADEFAVIEVAHDAPTMPKFNRDKSGKIEATIQNLDAALRSVAYCGVDIRLDEFRDEVVYALHTEVGAWRPFTDSDYVKLRIYLESRGFKPIGRELIRDVVMKIADDNRFDTAILWLKSLTWDGVPRIGRFYIDYLGAEDSAYTQAASIYTWTALAGRVLVPGIKADMVPILVGDQGTLKTTAVASMVPSAEFFTEISFHEREDDLARKLRGRLIGEIGELRGLHTKEQESIKAFITRTHEHWIPKYREFATTFARRLVFIGTTNQEQFLADDTGNRRWLPIPTQLANVEAIKRDRNQLWAEARVMFDLFGIDWSVEMLSKDVHDEYMMTEQWEEEIRDWLHTADALTGEVPITRNFLRTNEIAKDCLRIDARNLRRVDEMQIGRVLKKLGYARKKMRVDGKPTWVFTQVFLSVPT